MNENETKPIGGELNWLGNLIAWMLLGFQVASDVVLRKCFGECYPGGYGICLIAYPFFFLALANQPHTMLGSPIPLWCMIALNLGLLAQHVKEYKRAAANGEMRHPKSNGQSRLGRFQVLEPWVWIVLGVLCINHFNVPLGIYMVFTGVCSGICDGIGKHFARQRRRSFLVAYFEHKQVMAPLGGMRYAA